jgi:hypothetical protein
MADAGGLPAHAHWVGSFEQALPIAWEIEVVFGEGDAGCPPFSCWGLGVVDKVPQAVKSEVEMRSWADGTAYKLPMIEDEEIGSVLE